MNSEKTIEASIKSLINQSYKDIEHIIIDGDSQDDTLNIVGKYKKHIKKIISEKDKGIYYALNKGISNANGDIIGFLHSDDRYYSSDIIEQVVDSFKNEELDSVIGDLIIINPKNQKTIRYYRGSSRPSHFFSMGIMPPHPTVFLKKTVYDKFGDFNIKYKIASDYELLFRFIVKNKIKYKYIPKIFISMNKGGLSTKSYLGKLLINFEIFKIHKYYRYPFNPLKKLYYRLIEYNS